jgi:beta-xylosidase
MRKVSIDFATKLLAIVGITISIGACDKEEVSNPVLDYPNLNTNLYLPRENGDSAFIADPHVIKVGDEWFLYGTGYSAEGLAVWSSKDLVNWEFGGLAWKPTPGSWNTIDIWAPDVFKGDDGKFYMYYTAASRIGVAVANSPLGPFLEVYDHPFIGGGYGGVGDGKPFLPDQPLLDVDDYAIDAHVFKATDGSLTIYFSILTPFSAIVGLPMKDYVTLADDKPVMLIEPQVLSWENFNREGPFVLERNGVFHMMYSGALWFTNEYALGVATGPSPLGPFTRRADNPILRKSAEFNLAGCGHHSVVEGKNNDLLVFYHTREWGDKPSAVRKTRYMRMFFDRNGQMQVDKVPNGGQ